MPVWLAGWFSLSSSVSAISEDDTPISSSAGARLAVERWEDGQVVNHVEGYKARRAQTTRRLIYQPNAASSLRSLAPLSRRRSMAPRSQVAAQHGADPAGHRGRARAGSPHRSP